MAASSYAIPLLLSLCLFASCVLGFDVVCRDVVPELCAFAVSAESKRCVLERAPWNSPRGPVEYICAASEVTVAGDLSNWIETDECVRSCGVDRAAVGISSDSLLDSSFLNKLCSPVCSGRCPNIVDLYSNLAAGEGVLLSELCQSRRDNLHRSMAELLSSGAAAGPAGTAADFAAEEPTSGTTPPADGSVDAPSPAPEASPQDFA